MSIQDLDSFSPTVRAQAERIAQLEAQIAELEKENSRLKNELEGAKKYANQMFEQLYGNADDA